ncbi:hypothetical protein WJX74_007306 [Apatococcus lobatus]|uniref:Uncharacterized protein n=1 Tax=Apatococcus lobatus TaxID=904363 RepID=A0AAW1RW66_9CHLO
MVWYNPSDWFRNPFTSFGKAAAEVGGDAAKEAVREADLKGAAATFGSQAIKTAAGKAPLAATTCQAVACVGAIAYVVKPAVDNYTKYKCSEPKTTSLKERADLAVDCFELYGQLPNTSLVILLKNASELPKVRQALRERGTQEATQTIKRLFGSCEAAMPLLKAEGREQDGVVIIVDQAYTKAEASHASLDLTKLHCSIVKSSDQFQTEFADIIPASEDNRQTLLDRVRLTKGWFSNPRAMKLIEMDKWRGGMIVEQEREQQLQQQRLEQQRLEAQRLEAQQLQQQQQLEQLQGQLQQEQQQQEGRKELLEGQRQLKLQQRQLQLEQQQQLLDKKQWEIQLLEQQLLAQRSALGSQLMNPLNGCVANGVQRFEDRGASSSNITSTCSQQGSNSRTATLHSSAAAGCKVQAKRIPVAEGSDAACNERISVQESQYIKASLNPLPRRLPNHARLL